MTIGFFIGVVTGIFLGCALGIFGTWMFLSIAVSAEAFHEGS